MSTEHPVIAITGSSGAGTTTVTRTFEHIFRREGINAAIVEGDSFHRYDRTEMKAKMAEASANGNQHFSHFGPEANRLEELEALFRGLRRVGTGKVRKYLHNERRRRRTDRSPARSRRGTMFRPGPTCCSTRACMAESSPTRSTSRALADLLIGVVPIINLEWIQKLHRDKNLRGYSHRMPWSIRFCAACRTT